MTYIYGSDGVKGFIESGVTYLFSKNLQGDVTEIYNESGTLVGSYVYDAWGNHKIETDVNGVATLNPFRYRGYYYDTETGLYYLQTRYYDPQTGRFINADDISYLDPETLNGLNLYAYCLNNPVSLIDSTGTSPTWWQWLIGGLQTLAGIALCFVPGAQVFGVGLIVSGVSSLASSTMSALGLDDKLSMQIQSALNVVGGIALMFVPGMGGIGASMIGAGVLSFAGGYISEAGGSYGLGWGIGNIVGSLAGGIAYKGIVNRLNTPANMIKSFEKNPQRWKLLDSVIEPATGKKYLGGISDYSKYRNIWTNGRLGTHTITRLEKILHFHYFF